MYDPETEATKEVFEGVQPSILKRLSDGKVGRVVGWSRDSSDKNIIYDPPMPAELVAAAVPVFQCIRLGTRDEIFFVEQAEGMYETIAADVDHVIGLVFGYLYSEDLIDQYRVEELGEE